MSYVLRSKGSAILICFSFSQDPAKSRSHDSLRSGSSGGAAKMESSSTSERRMARYKEERRRQLANQIAHRLQSGKQDSNSSSSSDENDKTEPATKSSSGAYKYRRRKGQAVAASPSPSAPRRRRRRSFNSGSSPSSSLGRNGRKVSSGKPEPCDADGEYDVDDTANREVSPEHIYHQIGSDSVVKLSKKPHSPIRRRKRSGSRSKDRSGEYHAVRGVAVMPAQPKGSQMDAVVITSHQSSRKPRQSNSPSKGQSVK